MSTIPASNLVAVLPSVLGAGGNAIDVIGLLLTSSARVPIGDVHSFSSASSVDDYFGASSQEASLAAIYFAGFDNSQKKPASVLFAQYNSDAVAAYLRGGSVSSMTLAELQALSGSLSVVIDGVTKSAASINLSAATSFSNAAQIIGHALAIHGQSAASITGSISGTTMTVTAVGSGALAGGDVLSGTGVTAQTYIVGQLGGAVGGTGTYQVSPTQTALSQAITAYGPGVEYDSVTDSFVINSGTTGASSTLAFATGTLAASLKLTSATGAVLSQGAIAAVPAAFMNSVIGQTTDWVTFMTTFDPDDGSGNSVKEAFADWKNTKNNRYGYVCWDTDQSPTADVPATGCLGYLLDQSGDSGTMLLDGDDDAGWDDTTGPELAAMVCGSAASIDFSQRNGRITFAYRKQAGIEATVTDETIATNLGGDPQTSDRGNGYNYYGAFATANTSFVFLQRGFTTGDFLWFDSYINQIWLNNSLQVAILNFLAGARSVPYGSVGNALIEQACAAPIQAGLNFGAFGPGVLSTLQISEVNTDAGLDIATTLQTQGYYLQIGAASAAIRAARTSPPCKFWYLDNGSIQAITLNSIAVQ